MGRNQQRKEQGVKRMNHRMERPKSTPLVASAVKKAKHARTFRNNVTQYTERKTWKEGTIIRHEMRAESCSI